MVVTSTASKLTTFVDRFFNGVVLAGNFYIFVQTYVTQNVNHVFYLFTLKLLFFQQNRIFLYSLCPKYISAILFLFHIFRY